jgi:hypothetical protein
MPDLDMHAALTEQLRQDVGAVAAALDALIGTTEMTAADRVHARAPMWAANLLGGDDKLAAQTVIDVMCVIGADDHQPIEWWATPLGRAVARSVGHPTADTVSYSVAGAMLGVTKQAIHKMVKSGRLTPGRDGGVTVASVQALIRDSCTADAKSAAVTK